MAWKADDLKLPEFKSPELTRTARCVNHGDDLTSKLTVKELHTALQTGQQASLELDLPNWVNTADLDMAKTVTLDRQFSLIFALVNGLLHMYAISRISEVLVRSRYAEDPYRTYVRFRDTGIAVYRWLTGDLTDPSSPARRDIVRVRCMHELARRHVRSLDGCWPEGGTAGCPVGQFDLAIVLNVFTAWVITITTSVGDTWTDEEKRVYIHRWRVIGYFLGIEDECNICESPERVFNFQEELFSTLDCSAVGPAGTRLAQYFVSGFGRHFAITPDVVSAMANLGLCGTACWRSDWMHIASPSKCSMQFTLATMAYFRESPTIRRLLNEWVRLSLFSMEVLPSVPLRWLECYLYPLIADCRTQMLSVYGTWRHSEGTPLVKT